jgi:hypothetical protein
VTAVEVGNPELQPKDERAGLVQRLDQVPGDRYHGACRARLAGGVDAVAARNGPDDCGVVKHLAWAEDRWFQGRLFGGRADLAG